MRSVEEWAKNCYAMGHYHPSEHCGAAAMCLTCTRAYARECMEVWRKKAVKEIEDLLKTIISRTTDGW